MFKSLPVTVLVTTLLAGPALATETNIEGGDGRSARRADNTAGKVIIMQGNGKGAIACVSCHGADGAGDATANFPRLAGLNEVYVAKQIADYKSGARKNPIMQPIAAALTAKEAADVGAYYASQRVAAVAPPAGKAQMALGKKLATRGNWDKEIPACFSCHAPEGKGIGAFPAIAGQHAGYTVAQIAAWKNGTRKNDPVELMKGIAERLSDEETAAVAAYLATL